MKEQDHINHNIEAEDRIVQDVEKYGFHMAFLESDGYLPAFVYTIGFYKTYQHPEIIIFGLKQEVMANLLHHIGEEIKKGTKFETNQEYNDFLVNYPIKFVEVDEKYYPDYLGYCGWFYNRTFDFPTYQLVWTDKDGNYPWEEGFYKEWKFKQPILDRNTDFKFYEERNLGVYTTQATVDGKPILWVYHNEDGSWQFHSEEFPETKNARIVCLENLVVKDPTLNEVYHLNYGQFAKRKDIDFEWEIFDDKEKD